MEGGTQAHLSQHKCVLIMHINLILPLETFLISHFNYLISIIKTFLILSHLCILGLKKTRQHCYARFNGNITIQQSLIISADTKTRWHYIITYNQYFVRKTIEEWMLKCQRTVVRQAQTEAPEDKSFHSLSLCVLLLCLSL